MSEINFRGNFYFKPRMYLPTLIKYAPLKYENGSKVKSNLGVFFSFSGMNVLLVSKFCGLRPLKLLS